MVKAKKENAVLKRKKPYFSYTKSNVEQALQLIKKGTSISAASKAFNVPYATLHSRATGKYGIDTKPGPNSILSTSEEKEIVAWIFQLNKCGFPVVRKHLLDSVQNIIVKTKRSTPFTNGRPSKNWFHAFLKRNPEVSQKVCQILPKSRANITASDLKGWFKIISNYLESKNIKNIGSERIFNLDESAFLLNPKSGKVSVQKGEKSVCSSDQECYTALIGGNAAGQMLPTMILYKYKRIPASVTELFPDEFIVGKSESGWVTSEIFYSYIVNHFYNWIINNKIELPVILYLDGYSSHVTMALSDFCCEKGIELISIFPNANRLMQPMDVALFRPLKSAYNNAVTKWRIQSGKQMSKEYFPSILQNALYSLDTTKILQNGFKSCGLYPFSEDAIDYSKLMNNDDENQNDDNSLLCETVNTDYKSNDSMHSEINFSNSISYVEANINPDILKEFKNNKSEEWKGDLRFEELYKFWLKCTESNKANNG